MDLLISNILNNNYSWGAQNMDWNVHSLTHITISNLDQMQIWSWSHGYYFPQTMQDHNTISDVLLVSPSPFLTCCAILPTSFGGKGPHLRRWLVAQPLHQTSSSWGFLGFSSAVRQMPGDLCTAPRIISLSLLSLATDVTDATLGASGLWLGTRTGAAGTATLA